MNEIDAITTSLRMYDDGYNQALEDVFNLSKQNAYDDGVGYSIGVGVLDELVTELKK